MKPSQYIRFILLTSFIVTVILAHKLWFGDARLIPKVPIWPAFISLNTIWQNMFSASLCLGLILSFFRKSMVYGVTLAAGAFAVLVCDDINRLQSYYYQYIFMLIALAGLNKQSKNAQLSAVYLMLIGIYLHSGLTKLNSQFIQYVFPNMLYTFNYVSLENWQQSPWQFLAYIIPLGEMLLGLLLFIPRARKTGMYAALLLHLCILYAIGPTGLDWNPIVWIWNIAMIAINSVLFHGLKKEPINFQNPVAISALTLFIFLPLLNRVNLWDNYLSFSLYSGTTPNRQLHISEVKQLHGIPLFAIEQDTFVDLNVWSLQDIQTAIYAEDWVFDEVGEAMCDKISCDSISAFEVYKQSIIYIE